MSGKKLREGNPNIERNIFRAIHAVHLDTFPGYKSDGEMHSFLEKYDAAEEASAFQPGCPERECPEQ